MQKITSVEAGLIFDILKEECGADESIRSEFVNTVTTEGDPEYWCREFRFQGDLGFGGKFYNSDRLRVDYYPEDETPERKLAARKASLRIWRLFPYTYQQDEFSFLTVEENRKTCQVPVAWLVMLWRHLEIGEEMVSNAQVYIENKIYKAIEGNPDE